MQIIALAVFVFFVSVQASAKVAVEMTKCEKILRNFGKEGVSAEMLRAFQKKAESAGILDDIEGKKLVALVDLTMPVSDSRFFVIDLKTGRIAHRFQTSRSSGGASFGAFEPGHHAAPSGLMRIASQFSGPNGLGNILSGLESNNKKIANAGLMIQTCRNAGNKISDYISKSGSFCLRPDSYRKIGEPLRGSYLYSVRPEDHNPLPADERSKVCSLFGLSVTGTHTQPTGHDTSETLTESLKKGVD